MAQLELVHEERSDNKALVFTDISNWVDLTDAQLNAPSIIFTITYYGGTTYTIPSNLIIASMADATTVGLESDIKYIITADLLGLAEGALITDDVYTVSYTNIGDDDYLKNILVYGVAKQAVWQRLAQNDDNYLESQMFSPDIEKALVNYAFLLDLEASTYCAEIIELQRIIVLLNNLI